ncbi:putative Ran exchange factor Prp20/Pim1 [Mariannaea sp. PMI_226]|nr:putative Ran exchange factor Prp20/Pim1 [Mariannaea sp. PMI_226]
MSDDRRLASTTTRPSKRKQSPVGVHSKVEPDQPSPKKAKTTLRHITKEHAQKYISAADSSTARINQAPTQVLTVLAFGNGESSELGLGVNRTAALSPQMNTYLDPNDPSKFHVVQLSCGGMHTIALTADNKILTWGVNDEGALGRDTSWDGGLRDVDADSDDEDGALNPHECVPSEIPQDSFPSGTKFTQVAAGDSCSLALTDTGFVYGWGTFRNPESDKRFWYDSSGNVIENQRTPILIAKLQNITQIACGANHALALDKAGRVWGWGSYEQNQLGSRPFGRYQETLIPREVRICPSPIKYIASGEYHSFAIDRRDNVWAWGLNSFGEAGYAKAAGSDDVILPHPMKIPTLSRKGVIALDGGMHHSAAITNDGQCLMWGRMDGGQLGINFIAKQLEDETIIRRDEYGKARICLRPTLVPGIGHVVNVACGTDHTIFINQMGHGYSTGFGTVGQLGLGTEDDETVAKCLQGKQVKGKRLTWAGAGGQFSMVASSKNI